MGAGGVPNRTIKIANADALEKFIKEIAPDCNVKKKILTPIVGSHLGPGALVVSFYGN